MTKYVPTATEREIIKQFALKEAKHNGLSTKGVFIQVGERINTENDLKAISMNLRLVTDHPTWDDTDLHDFADWSQFTAGFELSEKGEAEIDFYLYDKLFNNHGQLCCNMQAVFDAKGLLRLDADTLKGLWSRKEEATQTI